MTVIQDNKNLIPRTVIFSCNCCNKQFVRYSTTKPKLDYRLLEREEHYCSHACAYSARKPTKTKILKCTGCNCDIDRLPSTIKTTNFCSRKCYWQYRKVDPRAKAPRKPCSKECKRKISEANKGNQVRLGSKLSQESKDKIAQKAKIRFQDPTKNPMYGRKHDVKAREAMSKAHSALIQNGKKTYGNNHNTGYYMSNKTGKTYFYRSKWEQCCMEWLDKNLDVASYAYETIQIPYWLRENNIKQKRYYTPDFLITFTDNHKEMWEIKPKVFQENLRTQLKTKAAQEFCAANNISKFCLLDKAKLQEMKIL